MYHGLWRENGSSAIVVKDASDEQVGIVHHLPKHSPTGMNWGYAGAGPADTARSLLIAALGTDALCPACLGTGRVVYVMTGDSEQPAAEPFDPESHRWATHGWKCECDGGYKRLPYPDFTAQFVTRWGKEWVMSRASILDWLQLREKLRTSGVHHWPRPQPPPTGDMPAD
jgi:hypothetical protein